MYQLSIANRVRTPLGVNAFQTVLRETMRPKGMKLPRERSLDVLRGIGVVLMVICEEARTAFSCRIAHAPWHGFALADMVFPIFLFSTGYAVSLTPMGPITAFLSRIYRLTLLGIVLQPSRAPNSSWLHLPTIRIPGVLQRIAFAALFPRLVLQFLVPRKHAQRGSFARVVALSCTAIVLSAMYFAATHKFHSCRFDDVRPFAHDLDQNMAYDVYHPSCNAARELDRMFFSERHMHWYPTYRRSNACSSSAPCASSVNWSSDKTFASLAWDKLFVNMRPKYCEQPFDPEGLLSALNAAVAALIGALFAESQSSRHNLYLSGLLALAGWLSVFLFSIPINKSLYTTSYLLISSGIVGALFVLARCDFRVIRLFDRFGRYSLRMFLLGGLALPERLMQSIVISLNGLSLFDLVMRLCRSTVNGDQSSTELVYAGVKLTLMAALASYWDRRRVSSGMTLRGAPVPVWNDPPPENAVVRSMSQ